MDYKEKYEQALERAKAAIDVAADKDLVKGVASTIFPELAESEDERIRKQLVDIVAFIPEANFKTASREECHAYLEKQKENPKSADSIPSNCVSDAKCEDKSPKHSDSYGTDIRDTPAYWKGWDDAMKQKEQNHPKGCFTCDEYKKGYEIGRLNGFTAGYNKAMKEVDQKEQKPVEVKDPSMEELEAHSKALHDFKVFAAKQAEEHHISFVHDFEWNNFCGEILSYFNEQKYTPKFKVGDKLMSNGNHLLTYKILEVGHINELGNPEYKVEIFTDGKLDEPHNIHYMECRRVDEWGKLKEQKPLIGLKQ